MVLEADITIFIYVTNYGGNISLSMLQFPLCSSVRTSQSEGVAKSVWFQ